MGFSIINADRTILNVPVIRNGQAGLDGLVFDTHEQAMEAYRTMIRDIQREG